MPGPLARSLLQRLDAPAPYVPTFRGAALEAQHITSHEWILAGPAETGKTWGGLWRLDTLLRSTPKAHALIVRKVREDMTGTVLVTWERVYGIRGGVEKQGGTKPTGYVYPNGATVQVVGLDRGGKVLSGEFDWVFVNQAEELDEDDWATLASRTTGRGAVTRTPMVFGDCNPGPAEHWIPKRQRLRMLHSRHEDNPTLFTAGGQITEQGVRSMEVLEALPGVLRERLRYGRWVSAEGVVYDGFDRAVHVVPSFQIPATWRRYRSIDFGFTNPFSCSWYAEDPDGRLYHYRQIYRTRRTVREHAQEVNRLSYGESYEATISDHDAEDRATLEEDGIYTRAAEKAVSVGIQAVQTRLKKAGDGKPRLFFMADALVARDETLGHRPVCTIQEFEVYAWPKGADGRSLKEEPVKQHDHGLDELRYMVMYLDFGRGSGEVNLVPMFEHRGRRGAF